MSAARVKTTKKNAASRKTSAKSKSARRRTTKPKRQRVSETKPGATVVAQPRITESELVETWFRLLSRCRGAWLQQLWMADGSIDGRATVTHSELAGILADQDSPEAEREWSLNQEPIRRWKNEAGEVRRAIDSFENSRLARLAKMFGLSREEIDLLQLCAAVAFDPSLARVCAYLQDHSGRTYLTEHLASRLLGFDDGSAWTPEMNVFRWDFVQRHETGVGEPVALICDAQIKEWLLGKSTLDEPLIGAARLVNANGHQLPEWPVDEISKWIEQALQSAESRCLRLIVVAPQGGGKRKFAAAVCHRLGMPLLIVNVNETDDANWSRLFLHAQRQVFLDTAALAWTGDAVARRRWPANQVLFPIQFVLAEPGSEPASMPGTIDRYVKLPMPGADTREKLWLESSDEAKRWPADELHTLAERHSVWPGDIELASRLGAGSPAEAALHVRERARSRFGNLAQVLECPFEWDDLVLPDGVKQFLEAIAFEAEERNSFWQQEEARRLFPQGRGLIALFSGASGTGKTMATQVIAGRLAQDLCRVNVAQLVSKWVGETPKNVEQVIRVAAENNVVLFFDEADALFGRRSTEIRDAQDKFANTDSAFLLQAIESYPGIAILATNLKTNIDAAFLRRLRYVVEFPKPDAALQCILWTKLVSVLAGEKRAEALAPAFELLSSSTEATGAQIKFAVLAGLFAARAEKQPLDARHLLRGLDRELAKEGRAIGPRERDKVLRLEQAA
jgi:hypothetical protein